MLKKRIHNFFSNKVVIVTGASSGIGQAMAKLYSQFGAKVVLAARNEERLREICRELFDMGHDAVYHVTDVTREKDCRALIDYAVSLYGRIDILICNAGLSMRAIFDDVELSVLHRLMDVNFWGTVNCCKYALPYLQRSQGTIVGISSVAGLHGLPGRTGYSASKFAMTGFLETLRIENLKKGLHVMIACPGFTASNVRFSALTADGSAQGQTPRTEGEMMQPEQVAMIVAKDIIRRRRLSLMEKEGWATFIVKKFAPGFLDKMFYMVMSREPNSPFK
ncbi:MAG: SDR family oxidoreductase [Alistipes sp.]|nr:SDR family oxidoreductase [Candidatus Alistipes equi]